MAETPVVPDNNPFEMSRIRQLVRLMRDNDLSEIDLRWGDARISFRRGPLEVAGAYPAPLAAPMVPQAGAPHSQPMESAERAPSKPAPASDGVVITSPIVGTFYSASGPDSPPFVAVGAKVSPEKTVCIIEAMKVFNEIPAGVSGTIAAILVENGSAVEYGQPLFRVEP